MYAHVDRAALRELVQIGGVEFTREVVETFVRDAKEDVAGMVASVKVGDYKRMREHSHRVRGAAAYVGAHELNALCEQTSAFAKDGKPAMVAEYLRYVTEELEAVVRDFGPALAEATR